MPEKLVNKGDSLGTIGETNADRAQFSVTDGSLRLSQTNTFNSTGR